MGEFTVKDSGERQEFPSGMVRDVTEGKIDYSLVLDGPMFKRLAIHLTKGAVKYAKRNWMKARGQEELDRFRESALRHFLQWYDGQTDEDHAAAVYFNINGAEYVKEKLPTTVPKYQSVPARANPLSNDAYSVKVRDAAKDMREIVSRANAEVPRGVTYENDPSVGRKGGLPYSARHVPEYGGELD